MRNRKLLWPACWILVPLFIGCGSPSHGSPDSGVPATPASSVASAALDPPEISGAPIPFRFGFGASTESARYRTEAREDGYVVEAQDPSGQTQWRTEVSGARGDVRVEIAASERGVIVWVRSEASDFVDLVDEESGRVLGRTRFARNLTRVPLEPPESAVRAQAAWRSTWSGRAPGVVWRGFEQSEGGLETAIAIARTENGVLGDEPFWTFRDAFGCIALALIETEDTLIAAQHCGVSSGVWVHALSLGAEPGTRERWIMRPSGVAPTGQWTASNDVAIALIDGYLRVWGREMAGRYVSTIDLETGLELASLIARE